MSGVEQVSDFDALIARIRQEAQKMTAEKPQATPALLSATPPVSIPEMAPMTPFVEGIPHLEDFFVLDDEEFLAYAYQVLLQRAIDQTGHANYMAQLRQGASRLQILSELMRSDEGQAQRVDIKGMSIVSRALLFKRLANKLPGFQWLGRWVDSWIHRYERYCFAPRNAYILNRKIQILHQALAQTQTALNLGQQRVRQSFAYVDERTACHQEEINEIRQSLEQISQDTLFASEDIAERPNFSKSIPQSPDIEQQLAAYYVAFEDANRGSREAIFAKLAIYDSLFERLQQPGRKPALDIGCGRGEFLNLCSQRGIRAEGVDMNGEMVLLCREAGHLAYHQDALRYLQGLPDASRGAIVGFHIIEHLPFHVLFQIFAECRRVLQPGGFILFETPNPENVLVGSHTFYHDFTHRNPITPTAIQFLAHYHQFVDMEIIRSSPYPAEARVPGNDPLTERVNGHLCGPQDFALVAYAGVAG